MIDILKKITFLFALFVGVVNAMDHSISRKESKFDFLKLHELKPWYETLSAEQKEAMQSNIKKQDQKSLALFKVATQLLPEVQKLVVAHMFDGYSYTRCFKDNPNKSLGEYEGVVSKLYQKEIGVVFDYPIKAVAFSKFLKEDYDKSHEACREREYYRLEYPGLGKLMSDPNAQHIIFELLEDILVLSRCCRKGSSRGWHCNKSELQSIERVVNRSPDMVNQLDWITFKCHDSFTFDNFKKWFDRDQWALLPLCLLPFVSKLVAKPWYEDYDYIDQSIVEKNNIKEFVNTHLQDKYNETGDSIWLSGVRQLKNPLVETWKINDDALVKKIAIYASGGPLFCMICDKNFFSRIKQMKQDGRLLENGLCLGIYSIITGGSVFLIKSFYEYIIPELMEPLLERPLLGIGCVTGLYALTVACYNFIKMRSWREDHIAGKDLFQLLRRTDIVIE